MPHWRILYLKEQDIPEDIFVEYAKRTGAEVTVVRTVVECLEALDNTQFDLLVGGMIMPVADARDESVALMQKHRVPRRINSWPSGIDLLLCLQERDLLERTIVLTTMTERTHRVLEDLNISVQNILDYCDSPEAIRYALLQFRNAHK